ncbi:hypothetical protein Q7I33_18870, partial [Aeromonas allosaccharophila]|uniref:hypothetical protein n=1 Tax=Aeromonas allosaccharophila TaxID=656 RepID=UPI0030064B8A
VLAGQGWRSYLRSRATPRSYEGMVKLLNKNNYHLYRWGWIFTLWLITWGDVKVNSVNAGGNICNRMSEYIAR